jgi:putative ABC transport system permease protein
MSNFALAVRLARRELRSGLSGFRIFFACLVLGVAAIAAVGSLSDALLYGLASQGRVLLGGDVSVGLVHRAATGDERAFLEKHGKVSETISMRGMAYALKNGQEADRQLIELKAVDGAYPMYGAVTLAPNIALRDALQCSASECGVVAEQTLLDRLHLVRGGLMRVGSQNFRINAVLTNEPDRLSGGFSLGPHVIVSDEGLKRTGLVVLGSLIEYHYRVAMPASASLRGFRREARRAFPDAGWQIEDRNNAAPGIRRFVEQVTMFLTLVGLTALAVGGVGAGQAVSAFIGRKRAEIATLKALGADGQLIFLAFFLQVMAVALAAVIIGLIVGALLPFGVEYFYGAEIPAPALFAIYPAPLLLAAVFGIFSAAAFSIPPLARAREIAPAHLFRDIVAPADRRGRIPYLIATGLAALVVVGLALALAPSVMFALWFLLGIAGGLVLLRLVAFAMQWSLRRLPRPSNAGLRLALSNMTRPGGAASSIVVALGLGLTLLAAVTLLDHTIAAQVEDSLPGTAPTFFFVDIQPDQTGAFDKIIKSFRSETDYERSPMIRGRITALNNVAAKDLKVDQGAKWVLNGDRGITYASTPPKGSDITQGKWWPANYTGQTLISFDGNLAEGLHLKLGDTITVNVLGREITGKIANFRDVNFSNGRQNFVMVFSPGLLDHAPHDFLATVRVAPRDEEAMYRAVTDKFQNVSTVRVKDAIAQVNGLLQELSDGVRDSARGFTIPRC